MTLLVAAALAAAITALPAVDGRPLGAVVLRALVCAVREGCGDDGLEAAYGPRDAALVRRHAPSLVYERGTYAIPVDYRRCRSHRCADAPDDRDLDVSRSRRGEPATAFTHVVRRGGRTYVQYWLYYPDSASSFLGSRRLTKHLPDDPFHHPDDWEGYVVRIDPDGSRWARATSHGHWQSCKQRRCRGAWAGETGWTRVSRGSHAGHLPGRVPGTGLRERSTTAPNLRLVPAEPLRARPYRALDDGIKPPWRKSAWTDPEAPDS